MIIDSSGTYNKNRKHIKPWGSSKLSNKQIPVNLIYIWYIDFQWGIIKDSTQFPWLLQWQCCLYAIYNDLDQYTGLFTKRGQCIGPIMTNSNLTCRGLQLLYLKTEEGNSITLIAEQEFITSLQRWKLVSSAYSHHCKFDWNEIDWRLRWRENNLTIITQKHR